MRERERERNRGSLFDWEIIYRVRNKFAQETISKLFAKINFDFYLRRNSITAASNGFTSFSAKVQKMNGKYCKKKETKKLQTISVSHVAKLLSKEGGKTENPLLDG